ncbi:MAG: histidine kinase [Proteobacteria bacterium]|nr:histidine kinase [Pseudomonadota bacterium]
MRLLLLDSPPGVEQFAEWLSGADGFEILTARDVQTAVKTLVDEEVEAVILSVSFSERGTDITTILDYCEPGNPSVLLVLEHLGDLDEFGVATNDTVEDFVIKPLTAEMLWARLGLIRRRRNNILLPRQALLAALPDLMFRISRDGTYIDYHFPSPEQAYVPGKELEGARIADVMPPDVAKAFLDMIQEVLEVREARLLEYDLPSVDGLHAYEARIVPSGAAEVLTIVRDVTERKRMDKELRAAAEVKQAFSSAVVKAQEAERQQLSRELHDGVGQILLVHRMDAEWLANQAEPAPLREAAESLCSSLDNTLETIRNLAMDLRPPAIDDLGIGSALETLVQNIGRRSGIDCQVEIQIDATPLDSDISVTLYRIAQEALANAIRHSRCRNIKVSLSLGQENLELQVRDDGIGFDPLRTSAATCMGLVSMRERAELVDGRVTIESGANQGTCVKVSVPVRPI